MDPRDDWNESNGILEPRFGIVHFGNGRGFPRRKSNQVTPSRTVRRSNFTGLGAFVRWTAVIPRKDRDPPAESSKVTG